MGETVFDSQSYAWFYRLAPVVVLALVCTVFIIFILIFIAFFDIHTSSRGKRAQIEQLRKNVTELGVDARTEDVLGKVVDVNMNIKYCERMNKIPIFDYFYPDVLCETPLIEIPH